MMMILAHMQFEEIQHRAGFEQATNQAQSMTAVIRLSAFLRRLALCSSRVNSCDNPEYILSAPVQDRLVR